MDIDIFRHVETHELRPEMDGAPNDVRRDNAIAHDLLLVVNVMQEQIQCGDALAEAAFHLFPFGARNDARDQIEREYPFRPLLIVVNRERHTLSEKSVVCDSPLLLELLCRHVAATIE